LSGLAFERIFEIVVIVKEEELRKTLENEIDVIISMPHDRLIAAGGL
jgi:hypothetical protein